MSETRTVPELSATSDLPVVQPDPVVAPAPEPAAAPAPAVAPSPVPEPRPIERRFSEMAAQRREAEAQAAELRKLVTEQGEQLKQALAALRPTTQVSSIPATTGPIRPSRDAFSDSESYETALVSWAGEQAAATAAADLKRMQEENDRIRAEKVAEEEAARERAERETEQARLEREFYTRFDARIAKKKEVDPEFDFQKIAQAPLSITHPMSQVIFLQDDGLDVADYLYKNPTEASRIANISVPGQVFPVGHELAGLPVPNGVAQAFELGKIAARLGSTAAAAVPASAETIEPAPAPAAPNPMVVVPQPTILPAPPTPLSGAAASATRKDAADMTMEEYAAQRMPVLRAERRPGRAVH